MKERDVSSIQQEIKEDKIDIIALVKTIWDNKLIIIKTTVVFLFAGLFIAFFSPKKYLVNSLMVPQISTGKSQLGGLSSLAAIAGFNLDMNMGSELSPVIYPKIIKSIPFKKELMQTKLNKRFDYKWNKTKVSVQSPPQFRYFQEP